MTDRPTVYTPPLRMVQGTLEAFFREFVERGDIEIGDRSLEQIFEDYGKALDEFLAEVGPPDFHATIDYRGSLLDRARTEAEAKHFDLAVTLYAIWIEHFINGTLTRALERKGYDSGISIPLIRELRLPTKASSLWVIAGLPTISDDDLKLLDQVIQFRNAFVHYKWQAYDEQADDQRRDRLRVTVDRASQLVSDLFAIESSVFWNGRETEIVERFREEVRKRWEKNPIEFTVRTADRESESGSPLSS